MNTEILISCVSEMDYDEEFMRFSETTSTDDGGSVINLGFRDVASIALSSSSSLIGEGAAPVPIFFNPRLTTGIQYTTYEGARKEIEGDQDHIIILAFSVPWSLPAQKTAINLSNFVKHSNQPVRCFFLNEDDIYDECMKLNIIVGTPVAFLFYQSKRILIHRPGKKPKKRIVGVLNAEHIHEIVTSCIAMSKQQHIFEVELSF